MELEKIKEKIKNEKTSWVKGEWEQEINSAFHKDSGLFLESEFFEIMKITNKDEVLKLIDMLINKVKEIK